ncbi:MAG: hypothetical protein KDM91_01530, partial [Verrucomicrobiae bacterium]|nr:hypothetical protein [Verrucomicrobiae bacterium]
MNLRLGIQGKIALLVVVAAAISAYLVARLLSKSAEELLRSHELVDLGDEAELRAWEIADRVDGLREDTLAMGYNTAFQEKFAAGAPREALRTTCEEICRRYWRYHVRIDVLTFDENGRPLPPIPIEEKAATDPEGLRVPDADELAKIQRGRLLLLSRIERMRLRYPADETAGAVARERWEPVVWAYTPLAEPAEGSAAPPPLLRVLMTLDSGESPRHLFALMTPSGDFLARPDEAVAGGGEGDNDRIFRALATHAEVRRHFEEENRMTPVEYRAEPQVEALHLFEYLPLESPYFFQEGVPRPNLRAAIDGIEETAMDLFFDGLRGRLAGEGRIGGLRLGTREARLLAGTPEKLDATRAAYDSALRERFGGAFDGLDWGPVVTCDEVHAWAIRLGIGTVEEKSVYVLLYAVMDDELASSIRQEMTTLRRYAFAVAVLAGAIAFAISLFFVYPLKRMTSMAQRVTESPPERLHTQLAEMVDELHVKRRDEVGDIARASKLLFEEVLESHERLENRVRERTAKLGQANLDLEEANEQLKSLSREKDSFVAKVSHDLRQPLNAIFLQVEALKLTDLDPLQASDVQKIHDHAARELSLVNDILEYQKIIMGAESLNRDRVAVPDLVAEVAEVHGKNADAKGIGFESAAEPATGEMEADRKRLRQILDNLAGNAVKFTAEGRVRIEANARTVDGADWIEFVVDDTGRGMGPEEQARAFVPFVSNKKGNEGGTGLGLSIC